MWNQTSATDLTCRHRAAALLLGLSVAAVTAGPVVHAQMGTDARAMSGIPLQMGDVPAGTVVVRVVRGDVSNVVAGHPVALDVAGEARTTTTDETGRAEFTGLPVGTNVKAATTLDGARIESQAFVVPPGEGVRLLLVGGAALPAGDAPPGASGAVGMPPRPAIPGSIVLGGQSRIIVEFDDDVLEVFYLLDFVNDTGTTLTTSAPFVVELPPGAQGASLLEGSSPQGAVEGRRLVVSGPFAPGATVVQAAYRLPIAGSPVTITQPFPVPFQQPAFMVQKVPGVTVSSPQVTGMREMPSDGGITFVTGLGASLGAGQPVSITLAGLPHHATWPRTLALVLACLVLGAGAWASIRVGGSRGDVLRRQLEARREGAFQALVRLEQDARAGRVPRERYAGRRSDLVEQLQRIYGELDSPATRDDEGQVA